MKILVLEKDLEDTMHRLHANGVKNYFKRQGYEVDIRQSLEYGTDISEYDFVIANSEADEIEYLHDQTMVQENFKLFLFSAYQDDNPMNTPGMMFKYSQKNGSIKNYQNIQELVTDIPSTQTGNVLAEKQELPFDQRCEILSASVQNTLDSLEKITQRANKAQVNHQLF